jgi:hypothetical protein
MTLPHLRATAVRRSAQQGTVENSGSFIDEVCPVASRARHPLGIQVARGNASSAAAHPQVLRLTACRLLAMKSSPASSHRCSRAPDRHRPTRDVRWRSNGTGSGHRAQVLFDGRSVAVRSRPGRICTDQFPELHELADVLRARRVVLDGELVCLGADGKPDFAALRSRLGVRGSRAAAAQRRNPSQLILSTFCTWMGVLSANSLTGAGGSCWGSSRSMGRPGEPRGSSSGRARRY